jgi:hypothetical protein
MIRRQLWIGILALFYSSGETLYAQVPAFPGAEGFGALATGGRGGNVYHVTNLEDTGKGSFRDAVSAQGRTIVFDIAGVIPVKDRIHIASDITIAGQTAPGDGIVLYGNAISCFRSSNIIIRHLRFRGSINMPRGACTVHIDSARNVILDHVSIEWGRWDNLHIKGSSDVTLQYCLIGEAIDPQRFGALLERPVRLSIHHSLWIDNQSRNPKAKAGIEYINNVIYNWGKSGFVGGHSAEHHHQDIISNYFIAGPNSSSQFLAMFTATDHVFQQGNFADTNKDGKLNGAAVSATDFIKTGATIEMAKQNIAPIPVRIDDAAIVYQKVMKEAGASIKRDAVDKRLIGYLQSLGKQGIIFKTETDAGGQGVVKTATALKDTDGDGMPDSWEKAHQLDAANAADGAAHTLDSRYTNLEVYMNGITRN